jgi:hypothetical protein
MKRSIKFSWQLVFRADGPLFGTLGTSPIVRLEEPPAYFNRISAKDSSLYHPIDVAFLNLFHIRLRRAISDCINGPIRGKKFPYQFFVNSFGQECRVGLTIQLFFPNLISVIILCYDWFVLDETTAFHKRSIDNHPVLRFISEQSVDILGNSLCPGRAFRRIEVKPIIKVHYDVNDNSFLDADEVFLPAFLINDENYTQTHKSVFERVVKANLEHNRKGELAKLILINKQGYLAATNTTSIDSGLAAQEITKRQHMFELGCVLRRFYQDYPAIRQSHKWEMDYLFFATRPYIRQPELTFDSSYGNTLAWAVILNAFKLTQSFDHVTRLNNAEISKLIDFSDLHSHPHYGDPAFWDEVRAIAR